LDWFFFRKIFFIGKQFSRFPFFEATTDYPFFILLIISLFFPAPYAHKSPEPHLIPPLFSFTLSGPVSFMHPRKRRIGLWGTLALFMVGWLIVAVSPPRSPLKTGVRLARHVPQPPRIFSSAVSRNESCLSPRDPPLRAKRPFSFFRVSFVYATTLLASTEGASVWSMLFLPFPSYSKGKAF